MRATSLRSGPSFSLSTAADVMRVSEASEAEMARLCDISLAARSDTSGVIPAVAKASCIETESALLSPCGAGRRGDASDETRGIRSMSAPLCPAWSRGSDTVMATVGATGARSSAVSWTPAASVPRSSPSGRPVSGKAPDGRGKIFFSINSSIGASPGGVAGSGLTTSDRSGDRKVANGPASVVRAAARLSAPVSSANGRSLPDSTGVVSAWVPSSQDVVSLAEKTCANGSDPAPGEIPSAIGSTGAARA
ncbi:hypothetical protein SAMN05443573_14116 [Celeribacter indicus]|nr:hypothetical protein SAMN05443573_14116 [Celeribacter indicus]